MRALFRQREDLVLEIAQDVAGQRELERRLDAGAMALALLQRDHRPAQVRHDLPVDAARTRPPCGPTRASYSCRKSSRVRDAAAPAILVLAEAPALREDPADVLERIAERGEFPVEHAGEPRRRRTR